MEENKVTETVINTDNITVDGIPIRIKYHSDTYALKYEGGEDKSNWIDLRCAEDVELKAGDFKLVSLGVSMELPKGYEAYLVPRSSTFKNYGILQTNGIGIIDTSYCGDEDIWRMPVYATRDTVIKKNDRIAQFRIMERQPKVIFMSTYELGNEDRGGFGALENNNERIKRPIDVIKIEEIDIYIKELFNIKLAENYIESTKLL